MSDVLYTYGFVPADAPSPPPTLRGVGDAPVALLGMGRVAAVVGRLPAADYAADAIEARLADLGWVGEQGMAHERVVLWFVDHADIVPARLFTLHSDEAAARTALAPDVDRIADTLRLLAGRREWNLKVAFDADRLARHGADVSEEVRTLDDDIAAAPPGRRYLLQRRRDDLLKREVGRAARRLADELLASLRTHADAVRVLPLADTDAAGTVVLNAALLVPRGTDAALQADAERRARELDELGIIVGFSGPWAPYRFVDEHEQV